MAWKTTSSGFLSGWRPGRCLAMVVCRECNTTYILPSGGLYNPYHLLGEPETAIDRC